MPCTATHAVQTENEWPDTISAYACQLPPNAHPNAPLCLIPLEFLRNHAVSGHELLYENIDVDPVPLFELDQVILGALDEDSYKQATDDSTVISSYLAATQIIARQSSLLNIPASSPSGPTLHRYRTLSALPLLQGLVTLRTRIIISNASALGPQSSGHQLSTPRSELDIASFLNTRLVTGEVAAGEDGLRYPPNSTAGKTQTAALNINAEPLARPIPLSMIFPTPPKDEDDEIRIIVPLLVLADIGVFSGSWALVSSPPSSTSSSRLCRIYGIPVPPNSDHVPRKAYLPPSLFFNLGSPAEITLCAPSVTTDSFPAPTAANVTLARVSSPVSNDDKGLDAALDALKKWFENAVRVVCDGDILTLVIDEEEKRFKILMEDDVDSDNATLPFDSTDDTRQVAFFKVTKACAQNSKVPFASVRIHPSETKLLQQGVVNSKIPPSIHRYMDADTTPPPPPARTDPAFTSLKLLMAVSLLPATALLDLGCSILLHGPRGVGKRALASAAADVLGIHIMIVSCFDLVGDSESKTEAALERVFDRAEVAVPCALVLRNVEALAKRSEVVETGQEPKIASVLAACLKRAGRVLETQGFPLLVIGTASDPGKMPTPIRTAFRHEIQVESPAEAARLSILRNILRDVPVGPDTDLQTLAEQTAALNARDLKDLVSRAAASSVVRVTETLEKSGRFASDDDLARTGVVIIGKDFEMALGKARAVHSDSIGAPKIPNVSWDDVGGLAHVKRTVLDTIQLPLEHPELFAGGVKKRSGILLYGPPGTGKTLMAKAVATTLSLNFLSVKGPELLNMYIGESEANVRKVFQKARDARPCVVFFDELDSVAPKRGAKADSGGVMDRIVSQLLAELDSIGGGAGGDVFMIGATNRPDLLDSALLRPGRFDKLLYLGVASDRHNQVKLLQALTRKFKLAPDLDLHKVAQGCPFNYTGADFYALCSDAMLKAMVRKIEAVDKKIADLDANPLPNHPHPITAAYFFDRLSIVDDVTVIVNTTDFEAAQKELTPSVSIAELQRYEQLRRQFAGTPTMHEGGDTKIFSMIDDRAASTNIKRNDSVIANDHNSIMTCSTNSNGSNVDESSSTLLPPAVSVRSDQESDDEFFVANSNPDQDVKGKSIAAS
ncbi:hypothetical protein SeLEV6574_g02797 [Synchytrium endobioticum]|nr:hypothetical protein SeLEV6574_g02797 [Synchytrium endobioticum]